MATSIRTTNTVLAKEFLDILKRGNKGAIIEIINIPDDQDNGAQCPTHRIITIKTDATKINNFTYIVIESIPDNNNEKEVVDVNYKMYSRFLTMPPRNIVQFIDDTGAKYQISKIEYNSNSYFRTEFPWLYYTMNTEGDNVSIDTSKLVNDKIQIYIKIMQNETK